MTTMGIFCISANLGVLGFPPPQPDPTAISIERVWCILSHRIVCFVHMKIPMTTHTEGHKFIHCMKGEISATRTAVSLNFSYYILISFKTFP